MKNLIYLLEIIFFKIIFLTFLISDHIVENLLMKFTFWLKENIIFICKKMFSNLKD